MRIEKNVQKTKKAMYFKPYLSNAGLKNIT